MNRVPSLAEIQSLRDPELNKIFNGAQRSNTQLPPEPSFSEKHYGLREIGSEIPAGRPMGPERGSYYTSPYPYYSRYYSNNVSAFVNFLVLNTGTQSTNVLK